MTDIVEKLRECASNEEACDKYSERAVDAMREAADTIVHLREMLERLIAPGGAARIGPSFAEITKDVPRKLVVE